MNQAKRIYIAGPMTGLPEHNFPAFHTAADRLRQAGWDVVNPAENFGGRRDLPRASYIRADVALLIECHAMALLPGWAESRGAKLEYLLARELGIPVIDVATLQPLANAPAATITFDRIAAHNETPDERVLDEAKRITQSDRIA